LFGATEEIHAHKTEILYCHDARIKFHENPLICANVINGKVSRLNARMWWDRKPVFLRKKELTISCHKCFELRKNIFVNYHKENFLDMATICCPICASLFQSKIFYCAAWPRREERGTEKIRECGEKSEANSTSQLNESFWHNPQSYQLCLYT
jgi:hypothetical protein